jgi:DNA-binding YbaB/EbfC family protein
MFEGVDLNEMMGKVQEMAAKAKEEGGTKIFTSSMGAGLLELSINGNSEVIDLKIDDSLLEDKDSLITFLISAMNDVIKQSDNEKKTMAINMMGGMNPFSK